MLINGIRLYARDNHYVQPNPGGTPGAVVVNVDYTQFDSTQTAEETSAFLGQLGFQHGCNTYLTSLGAPTVRFQL